MPQYHYVCPECKHEEDRVHKMSECDFPQECGECDTPMERVLQPIKASQVVWKCGLWTRDDYTSSGRPIKS